MDAQNANGHFLDEHCWHAILQGCLSGKKWENIWRPTFVWSVIVILWRFWDESFHTVVQYYPLTMFAYVWFIICLFRVHFTSIKEYTKVASIMRKPHVAEALPASEDAGP